MRRNFFCEKSVGGMTRWTALHGRLGFRIAGSSCLKAKGLRGDEVVGNVCCHRQKGMGVAVDLNIKIRH